MATVKEVIGTIQKELEDNKGAVYIPVNRQILVDTLAVLEGTNKEPVVPMAKSVNRRNKKA